MQSVSVTLAGVFGIFFFVTWLDFRSIVLFRGIYYVDPDFYILSDTLLSALFAKGQCGAKTITDNNGKAIMDSRRHFSLNVIPYNWHE